MKEINGEIMEIKQNNDLEQKEIIRILISECVYIEFETLLRIYAQMLYSKVEIIPKQTIYFLEQMSYVQMIERRLKHLLDWICYKSNCTKTEEISHKINRRFIKIEGNKECFLNYFLTRLELDKEFISFRQRDNGLFSMIYDNPNKWISYVNVHTELITWDNEASYLPALINLKLKHFETAEINFKRALECLPAKNHQADLCHLGLILTHYLMNNEQLNTEIESEIKELFRNAETLNDCFDFIQFLELKNIPFLANNPNNNIDKNPLENISIGLQEDIYELLQKVKNNDLTLVSERVLIDEILLKYLMVVKILPPKLLIQSFNFRSSDGIQQYHFKVSSNIKKEFLSTLHNLVGHNRRFKSENKMIFESDYYRQAIACYLVRKGLLPSNSNKFEYLWNNNDQNLV